MPTALDILEALPELLERLSGQRPELAERAAAPGPGAVVQLAGRALVVRALGRTPSGVLAEAARSVAAEARSHGPDAVPLLAVPYMGDVGRQICEDAGVGYVDLAGNADIKAPPLVIHVQGRPNRRTPRGRPSSVFAPKSSRIARLLLEEPSRWWSQSELAKEGSLGPGYVSRICRRLENDRLIERNPARALRARDPRLLLRTWQSHYDFDQHETIRGHVSARSGEELARRVSEVLGQHEVPHAMTGLAAAWKWAAFAGYRLVAVYIETAVPEAALTSLTWREERDGENLWLIRPKDAGVIHGASDIEGMRCVSAVQTYLDLQGMPERSEEAAEHLREVRLPWA